MQGVASVGLGLIDNKSLDTLMSDSSTTSQHSLRSGGSVVEPDSQPQSQPASRKQAAQWLFPEEAAFLQHLRDNMSGTDGLTFQRKVFTGAATLLAANFTDQRGGLKTAAACVSKLNTLKSQYFAAKELKYGGSSSGFTWSEDGGACIDEDSLSVWKGYLKVSVAISCLESHSMDRI
jgi:hypothetical protein